MAQSPEEAMIEREAAHSARRFTELTARLIGYEIALKRICRNTDLRRDCRNGSAGQARHDTSRFAISWAAPTGERTSKGQAKAVFSGNPRFPSDPF